jgi:DNA ligase-1
MRDFAALFDAIDATTATSAKVDALVAYFRPPPTAPGPWPSSPGAVRGGW